MMTEKKAKLIAKVVYCVVAFPVNFTIMCCGITDGVSAKEIVHTIRKVRDDWVDDWFRCYNGTKGPAE